MINDFRRKSILVIGKDDFDSVINDYIRYYFHDSNIIMIQFNDQSIKQKIMDILNKNKHRNLYVIVDNRLDSDIIKQLDTILNQHKISREYYNKI